MGIRNLAVFESLQFKDYRRLLMGSFASYMAMSMQIITRGWLVLILADDSPFALSLVMLAFAGPLALVSPLGGVLADRFSRRRMVMVSQACNAGATFLLAALDLTGLIEFWHLLVIGVVNGCLLALNVPSRQAIISDIVSEEAVMNAVSLNNSTMNFARMVGPAVAGVLIVYMGTSGVFFLIAGMYTFAVFCTARVQTEGNMARPSGSSVLSDIRSGVAYAASHRLILGLIVVSCLPMLFGFAHLVLLPAWAKEALSARSDGLGILMMMLGLGSLAGTIFLASVRALPGRGKILLATNLGWGVALAIFSQSTSYAVAVPLLALVGFLSSVFMSLCVTLLQTYSSSEMRGRVMSISVAGWGLMPLSVLPFGVLAERVGTPDALGLSGLLLVICTLAFVAIYPGIRDMA